MTEVKIIKEDGLYKIEVAGNTWHWELERHEVFDAMEEISIELSADGIEHRFVFE